MVQFCCLLPRQKQLGEEFITLQPIIMENYRLQEPEVTDCITATVMSREQWANESHISVHLTFYILIQSKISFLGNDAAHSSTGLRSSHLNGREFPTSIPVGPPTLDNSSLRLCTGESRLCHVHKLSQFVWRLLEQYCHHERFHSHQNLIISKGLLEIFNNRTWICESVVWNNSVVYNILLWNS
jgi:hypothetical protein